MNVNEGHPFGHRQWTVFIPENIMNKNPGFITGVVDENSQLVCLLEIIEQQGQRIATESSKQDTSNFIGYWHGIKQPSAGDNCNEYICEHNESVHSNQIQLYYDKNEKVVSICTCAKKITSLSCPAVCVYFNPWSIFNSYTLLNVSNVSSQNTLNRNYSNDTDTSKTGHSVIETLGNILHSYFIEGSKNKRLQIKKQGKIKQMLDGLLFTFPYFLMFLMSWVHTAVQSSFPLLRKVLFVPSFTKHLIGRGKRSKDILLLDKTSLFYIFIKYNILIQHITESVLGTVALWYTIELDLANQVASSFLDWADDVASRSNELILWLMGAPAGLKLNSQLTSMLGHFFIYHIYLWTGYLTVLRTVLPTVLLCGAWTGVMGLSFQLAIIKDIISMLTLHIYCFYVYAARIFNLQMSALASLWRLFRGKKWNVLRSRVDSAAYNTDQLFVGTLVFTVLLFLLPTTALYYTVFTALRMVTLIAQSVLSYFIECIGGLPVYSLFLRLLKPSWIAGNVEFQVVHAAPPPDNLILEMKTSQLSLSKLIHLSSPYLQVKRAPSYSWSHMISCVTSGRILYPWMEGVPEEENTDSTDTDKTKTE